MKRLKFPADLKVEHKVSYQRAKAYVASARLVFTPGPSARVENGFVWLSGVLANTGEQDAEVIVFPVGPGGFFAQLITGDALRWYALDDPERPRNLPPRQPPAPPPPLAYVLPARSEVAFAMGLDLAPMKYRGAPEVEVEWSFLFWNEPNPKGRMKVRLPPR